MTHISTVLTGNLFPLHLLLLLLLTLVILTLLDSVSACQEQTEKVAALGLATRTFDSEKSC